MVNDTQNPDLFIISIVVGNTGLMYHFLWGFEVHDGTIKRTAQSQKTKVSHRPHY